MPHEPLGTGRHQLPVLPRELAVGTEQELRVVDRAPVELVHADRQVTLGTLGGLRQLLGRGRRHLDRLLAELRGQCLERSVPCGRRHAVGVGRDERLGEHDDFAPRPAASFVSRTTFWTVASRSRNSGVACTAATVSVSTSHHRPVRVEGGIALGSTSTAQSLAPVRHGRLAVLPPDEHGVATFS